MQTERHRRWSENLQYDVRVARDDHGRFEALNAYDNATRIVSPSELPDDWDAEDVWETYYSL